MTEGQTLFLVLCLLYLPDCLVWVGRRSVLFSSPWCRRWRSSFGSRYLGNLNGGIALLNPLPPLGLAFRAHWSPLSVSPMGVCDLNLQSVGNLGGPLAKTYALCYEDISGIGTDGKWILLNGVRFTKCATDEQAETSAELIARLSRASSEDRRRIIEEFLYGQFNESEARRRFCEVSAATNRIRGLSAALFLFLYVLAPIVALTWTLHRIVIPVALTMLATAVFISLRFLSAHRRIHPSRAGDRVGSVVKMICCPPVAIRAGDFLALDAMSRFHPVLLADLFLEPRDNHFSRAFLSDLKHPLRHEFLNPEAMAIVHWYATAEFEACARFLKKYCPEGIDGFLSPPPWDGVSTAYCPRCSCQFTLRSGECPDCPGVRLLPLSLSETSEVPHEY